MTDDSVQALPVGSFQSDPAPLHPKVMSTPETVTGRGDRLGGLPPTLLKDDKREGKQIRGVLCHSWPTLKLQQWGEKG